MPIVRVMADSHERNPDSRAALTRLIDASTNRCGEGLRVLEDIARFVLDDACMSQSLKQIRHDVIAAIDLLPIDRAMLLASRDTRGDVGVSISTPSEALRSSLGAVAAAGCNRCCEALRSLEEAAKVLDALEAALAFESLRYALYTAGQQLELALGSPAQRQWKLCVLITESLCTGLPWEVVAARAIAGGADCVQLREKAMSDQALLARATRLVEIAREGKAAAVINDRPDIALASGADGVHVGQLDLPVHAIRAWAGYRLLIGVSTTNLAQARAACSAGADVCGVGPMYATSTKPDRAAVGPAFLKAYLADSACQRVPHLAIGGILPENIQSLTAIGCRGVAVSRVVCQSDHPEAVCAELYKAIAPPHTL